MPRLFATTSAVRPNPMQFAGNRISSSARAVWPEGGECTAFRIRSGVVHPCGFVPERVEAHAAHSFFRLGQGSAKFAAVPEQFRNSSFTCGHSSPLFLIRFFRLLAGEGKSVTDTKGKRKPARSAVVSLCRAVSVSLGPPSQWEREQRREPTTATESRGSRAILACSPESFRDPYFVNEPQTRGAAARPNTGRGRCPLSENLFRYMKKNPQQNLLLFAPFQAVKPERVKQYRKFSTLHPQPRPGGGGQKRTIHLLAAHLSTSAVKRCRSP